MGTQLIILGYHRSGTSAVTQHLAHAGLFVGEDLLGANPSNPFGHFEDRLFVRFHEALFRANSQHWLAPDPFVPIITEDLRREAFRLLAERNAAHRVWAFKDPRACLFAEFWRAVLPSPRFLVCLRHYRACADSVVRRALAAARAAPDRDDAALQVRIAGDHDAIVRSWTCHMLPLLRLMRRNGAITHSVDMRQMAGSLAGDLRARFGLPLGAPPIADTFRPDLFRSDGGTRLSLSDATESAAEEVWAALLQAHAALGTEKAA